MLVQYEVTHPMAVVAIRGYYRDTMGAVGKNDRGIYDDAFFVFSSNAFASFNGNCDPSRYRPGIATLRPGIHWYRRGKHGISKPGGGYPAFRPANAQEALPVDRDGIVNPLPGVAINIHRGGYRTTSSEGCQTIYPTQWNAFYFLTEGEMTRNRVPIFPLVLIEANG